MAFISFGLIDKNIIPILVGCIFAFLSRLLFNIKGVILFNHTLISNLLTTISKLFAFFPFIILKVRSRQTNKIDYDNTFNLQKQLLYINKEKQKIKNKYIYIFLSAAIFVAQGIIFILSVNIKTNSWIWDIIIYCVFCHLIFKKKLYIHHYLSGTLIILIGIIFDLIYDNLQNDISNNLTLLLLRFLREILFSLHDIVNKYVMEKKYCPVYELVLYNGLFCLLLFGIFSIFDIYFFHLDNFNEYFDNFNGKETFACIAYTITQFGLCLCTSFANKNNTPCHIFIIYVFGQLAYYIEFSSNSIIFIIYLLFLLFLSLVFNEIIELNFFGLSNNTKRNIMLRAEKEISLIDINAIFNQDESDRERKITLQDQNLFIELNQEP